VATTGLVRRVRHLEDADGGGECPRCSGVVVVTMDGEFSSASKDGVPMSEEEYEAHEAEEDGEGRCPVCGEKPHDITVGWPEP
jgi:DNA-directed RNA polymerase subunit RPC12/RpoP